MSTSPSLLLPSQAAELLGVSVRTVWNYTAAGVIPAAAVVRVGTSQRARFKRAVLERAGLIANAAPAPTAAVTP